MSVYRMKSGNTDVIVPTDHLRKFFSWESVDDEGFPVAYHRLLWGEANEILMTSYFVGDEPGMSYGTAELKLPQEAMLLISQHLDRSEDLNRRDISELEAQLQRRIAYSVGQSPIAQIEMADQVNYWRVLYTRAINVEAALDNGKLDLSCLGDFESALRVVLIDQEIAAEQSAFTEEAMRVGAIIRRLTELQANCLASLLVEFPLLKVAFEEAVRDKFADEIQALRQPALLFTKLRQISENYRLFRPHDFINALRMFVCDQRNPDCGGIVLELSDLNARLLERLQPMAMMPKPPNFQATIHPIDGVVGTTPMDSEATPEISVGFDIVSTSDDCQSVSDGLSPNAIVDESPIDNANPNNDDFAEASTASLQPTAPPKYIPNSEWILSEDLAKFIEVDPGLFNGYRKAAELNDQDQFGPWGKDVVGVFRRNACGRKAAYYLPFLSDLYKAKVEYAKFDRASTGTTTPSPQTPMKTLSPA